MLLELQKSLDAASAVVNEIELIRSQLAGFGRIVNDDEVKRAGSELEKAFVALEQNLVELRSTGRGQDGMRWRDPRTTGAAASPRGDRPAPIQYPR
jgi:hypothetical protein